MFIWLANFVLFNWLVNFFAFTKSCWEINSKINLLGVLNTFCAAGSKVLKVQIDSSLADVCLLEFFRTGNSRRFS